MAPECKCHETSMRLFTELENRCRERYKHHAELGAACDRRLDERISAAERAVEVASAREHQFFSKQMGNVILAIAILGLLISLWDKFSR